MSMALVENIHACPSNLKHILIGHNPSRVVLPRQLVAEGNCGKGR